MESPRPLRERLFGVLFDAGSSTGKAVDIAISLLIVTSLVCVILESVPELEQAYGPQFVAVEWVITIAFTLEYVLRLYCAHSRLGYALSFYGVIDLVSTLPLYLSILWPGAQSAMVVRGLRLLRLFRLFSHGRWSEHSGLILTAVRSSLPKVAVFLGAITMVALVLGATIYLVEGPKRGFTSIPQGMYWAISTLTTVGYGDVVPTSTPGRIIAAVVMVLGYGVVAIPVGIVSTDIAQSVESYRRRLECTRCSARGHAADSRFCRKCGYELRIGGSSGAWGSVDAAGVDAAGVEPSEGPAPELSTRA